ncbi:hypothetical protein BDY24DRAFT_414286 [Mrakia frigida]|uniref:class I SAM-dependent methyltransferase n=1 Tax=Mrakia frigida TaxID=29902 RepID=UPI003FCC09FC
MDSSSYAAMYIAPTLSMRKPRQTPAGLSPSRIDLSLSQTEEIKKLDVKKGAWFMKGGMKHHTVEGAVWSSDYETESLDNEAMRFVASRDELSPLRGLTRFPWKGEVPARVLELGCGSGSWTLEMASIWKTSAFTGMGLASIQPLPASLPDPSLASRLTWIKSNFLERLPFTDESFDFVSLRLTGGLPIPENSWDSLFEEVTRVLSPKGVFELEMQDSVFPGFKSRPTTSPSNLKLDTRTTQTPIASRLSTTPSSPFTTRDSSSTIITAVPDLDLEDFWKNMLMASKVNANCTSIAPASFILHFQPTMISKTTYLTPLPPSTLLLTQPVSSKDITLSHTHLASVFSHRQTLLEFLPDTLTSQQEIDALFKPYEEEADRYREWVVKELGWEERGNWLPVLGASKKRKITRDEDEKRRAERERGEMVEWGTRSCFGRKPA